MIEEGADVMGRWPGSNLYFKAKVTLVREEENEYDVEFENGTVFTIKAKDVYREKVVRGRSKSRGRSQGRSKKVIEISADSSSEETEAAHAEEAAAPAEEASPVEEAATAPEEVVDSPAAAEPVPVVEPEIIAITSPLLTTIKTTVRTSFSSIKSASKKVLAEEKPSRSSKRLAAKLTADAYSDDEGSTVKPTLAPNPELPDAHGYKKKKAWSFEWVGAIIFMVLSPTILVTLHTVCGKKTCARGNWTQVPKLSTDYKAYTDIDALKLIMAFNAVIVVLNFLPIGKKVTALNGSEVRMNGFLTLILCLISVGVMAYLKVPMNIVSDKYFLIMGTLIAMTFACSLVGLILSYWAKKSNLNKSSNGNPIVDFFNGREMNPHFLGMDLKLMAFRFSMITLAVLNTVMVLNDIIAKKTTFDLAGLKAVNPTIVIAAAFQVFYALDAMFFEEYYFHSHDAMNTGYGWSLINSYSTFPFLPTIITKYLIARSPHVAWYYLTAIVLVKLVGYVIFRSTEVQRCEFAKDPSNPALEHLETLETSNGRKIPVSGWWSIVRYPNLLGEFLIQWSWVLPVVASGSTDWIPYALPAFSTLQSILAANQSNQKNKRKYGSTWDSYCEKVRSNIIPKVY